MGGFVSGPGGLVSWIMGKPLVIHEQNAVSGLSNNLLSLIARQCLCAFPDAYRGFYARNLFKRTKKNTLCQVTGNPVRKEILALNKLCNKKMTTINKTIKILVIGGSLGAQKINEIVPQVMQKLQTEAVNNKDFYKNYEVRHQCGKGKVEQVKNRILDGFFQQQAETKINYQLEEFINDMADVYQWADLIICRSGALTISEIAVVGVASILIPFPYAVDDHQTENAKYLSKNQAAFLLPENKLTVKSLKQIIEKCNQEKLVDMATKAKELAKPNATIDATEHCLYWLDSDTQKHAIDSNGVIK
jgi:UDP-N-acetylglucosamine--N-acetylmuramyl-(pentapeptide) pyrophosphoryl-undecaprenol N-acetylglucosamine transferase